MMSANKAIYRGWNIFSEVSEMVRCGSAPRHRFVFFSPTLLFDLSQACIDIIVDELPGGGMGDIIRRHPSRDEPPGRCSVGEYLPPLSPLRAQCARRKAGFIQARSFFKKMRCGAEDGEIVIYKFRSGNAQRAVRRSLALTGIADIVQHRWVLSPSVERQSVKYLTGRVREGVRIVSVVLFAFLGNFSVPKSGTYRIYEARSFC